MQDYSVRMKPRMNSKTFTEYRDVRNLTSLVGQVKSRFYKSF